MGGGLPASYGRNSAGDKTARGDGIILACPVKKRAGAVAPLTELHDGIGDRPGARCDSVISSGPGARAYPPTPIFMIHGYHTQARTSSIV